MPIGDVLDALSLTAIILFAGGGCAGSTTTVPPATELAAHLAGFVAAEGCFTGSDGLSGGRYPSKIFAFSVGLGAADRSSCELLQTFFGTGRLVEWPRRRAHYDDEVTFVVRALPDLVGVVVPFMDEHLPPSHKRRQYKAWRANLLDYWEHRARRPRACTVEGCTKPRRAKGLCRGHYYARYGK